MTTPVIAPLVELCRQSRQRQIDYGKTGRLIITLRSDTLRHIPLLLHSQSRTLCVDGLLFSVVVDDNIPATVNEDGTQGADILVRSIE